ncbi:hypothetical protein [Okeania sp. SIO2B3]|nr:hypothetical protein [Okeania sp. SIO2B3]
MVTISFSTILEIIYRLFQPNNRKFNSLAESIYFAENEDAEKGSTIPPI